MNHNQKRTLTQFCDVMLNRSVLGNQHTAIHKQEVVVKGNSYESIRNSDIRKTIEELGYPELTNPSDAELTYVNSVFQSKGWHDIDAVTYDIVRGIGADQFLQLDKRLKALTSKMDGVNAAGIYSLISELSKGVKDVAIEEVYENAINAKPTVLAWIMSIFDKDAKNRSIGSKLSNLHKSLKEKSGNVNALLDRLYDELKDQEKKQSDNIKSLESAFKSYYEVFIELRRQFALIVYLEHSYKAQLEKLKSDNVGVTDFMITKKIGDCESIFNDIINKRMLIQKSMSQFIVINIQNSSLVEVCKTLLKEIDNTRIHSFPMIRANLQTVYVAIEAERAMLGNDVVKTLEGDMAKVANYATTNVALKAATLSADMRLRDAVSVKDSVKGISDFINKMEAVKIESQNKMQLAHDTLIGAADELNNVLTIK